MIKVKEFKLGKEKTERIDKLAKATLRDLTSIAGTIAEEQELDLHEFRIVLTEIMMAYTATLNMMTIELTNEIERGLAKK